MVRRGLIEIQREYRELLSAYLELVKQELGDSLKAVCVYGSVARGEAGEESDIDVLIIAVDQPEYLDQRLKPFFKVSRRIRQLKIYQELRGYGKTFSELVFTPEELERHPPILLEVLKDGVILYDPEKLLEKELEKLEKRLEELGAEIVETPKGHYWILKKDLKPREEVGI